MKNSTRAICLRIIVGVLLIYGVCPIVSSQTSVADLQSIKPNKIKTGQLVQMKVSYTVPKVSSYSYSTKNSNSIIFEDVYHNHTSKINEKNYVVEMSVFFRALQTGLLKIPPITDDNGIDIVMPSIHVIKSISVEDTTLILDYVHFPLLLVLHILLLLCAIFLFFILSSKALRKVYVDSKKRYYIYTNKRNVKQCIALSRRLLNILNKMATPKFRGQVLKTKESYSQMLRIITKRFRFLYGNKSLAFTHSELENIISQLLTQAQSTIARADVHQFFIAASEALYGDVDHDILLRRKHCRFLLEVMKVTKMRIYHTTSFSKDNNTDLLQNYTARPITQNIGDVS